MSDIIYPPLFRQHVFLTKSLFDGLLLVDFIILLL
jgi:hypothetical protein